MEDLLAGLNDAQKCAVSSPASVLQVLAPPGSGKTKTLTARVAYLLGQRNIKPWNIIVCTFTIKAAREMKDRIRGLVGDGTEQKLILGTFHSVARRFLVYYGHHIGIEKGFGIADSSDTLAILKRIIKRRQYSTEPGVARSRISGLKAKSISCDQNAAANKSVEQQEFAAIYTEYEETLKGSNLVDYDDLLLRSLDLLRYRPECVSNIEAVLIDEFQDTNHVQYELMRLMAQYKRNITIVGDPDQSIYGFRSAEIKNLKKMQTQYPETTVVILEENYRSGGAILQSAQNVIEQDSSRPAKALFPTHCVGEIPVLRRLPSAAVEAQWILTEIQRTRLLTGGLISFSDFAILLRSAALSRHIESALGKAGVPYRMVGGLRFFDRMEVKIVLDYLRVIAKPDHNDALVRVINVPPRKVGEVTVKSLLNEAEEAKVPLWSIILKAAQGNKRPKTKLAPQAEKGVQTFVNIILTSQKKLSSAESPCSLLELVNHVMKKLSFAEYIKKTHPEDFEGRWGNVEELIAQASDNAAESDASEVPDETLPELEGVEQRSLSSAEDSLSRFLANVALSTEVQQEGQVQDQVTISTIHAAKGLEWPVVFVPAVYEGSIPHSRAEDHDEERRLLYVAMTRAQALLYLSCPIKSSQGEETTLSPFLSDKALSSSFGCRGPSFTYTATQNLARILRRPCPTIAECSTGRISVERAEDDYYPDDGSDPDPQSTTWDFYNSKNGHVVSKRQRINDFIPVPEATDGGEGVGNSVTMNAATSFSISNTSIPLGSASGFVSASTRMQQMTSEAAAAEEAASAQRAERNLLRTVSAERAKEDNIGGSSSDHKRKADLSNGPNRKRQYGRAPPPGQGSLTSFFGQPTAAKAVRTKDEQVADAIAFVREKKMRTAAGAIDKSGTWLNGVAERVGQDQDKSHHAAALPKPVTGPRRSATTGKENQHLKPAFARPSFTSSNSFSAASSKSLNAPVPNLLSYKVRTEPLRSRPPRRGAVADFAAQNNKGRPYPFYSSSPPRDMAQGEAENEHVEAAQEQQGAIGDGGDVECAVSAADAALDAEDDLFDGDQDDALAPPLPSSPPPLPMPEPVEPEPQPPLSPPALHPLDQQQPLSLSMHTTSVDSVNNGLNHGHGQGLGSRMGLAAPGGRRPGRALGLRRDAGATGWVNRPFVKPTVKPRGGGA
ncbi:P-loop containing nucleoside triphosphate hydrolase protein [Phyllosticta citribraziliensis]|uniref:DNA 3'-5' helicase n=1 Tax=Phyllosticta citribraziliensis TaxID=989973 RepID=A0ABR1MAP5_9PEZI